jgi:lysophospholipase L1-like esterase
MTILTRAIAISALLTVGSITTAVGQPAPPGHAYAAATSGDQVVYAVGDSITTGAYATPAGRAWPSVVFDRLWGQDHTGGVVVAHSAQCLVASGCGYGATLVDTWEGEVLDATPAPTTVVVLIGTNDLGRVSDNQLKTAYQNLVTTAGARGIRVVLGTILPTTDAWWTVYWTRGAQGNRINEWLRDTYGQDVWDGAAAVARADTWARPETMSSDGLHPNNNGHADIAYAVPLSRIT